jgi:hypothetical protein
VIIDVELDQLDPAVCFPHHLLDDRGELLAGSAPRRPEIDQDRNILRSLDHVGGKACSRGVRDQIPGTTGGSANRFR